MGVSIREHELAILEQVTIKNVGNFYIVQLHMLF